jgi:hypothetical protein
MSTEVDIARDEAAAAKARLVKTADTLKASVVPAALVAAATGLVKARAAKFAINSLLSARRRPGLAAGVAVASALYAFRKPLAAAIRKRQIKETNNEPTD